MKVKMTEGQKIKMMTDLCEEYKKMMIGMIQDGLDEEFTGDQLEFAENALRIFCEQAREMGDI